jgi:hypothetical protein
VIRASALGVSTGRPQMPTDHSFIRQPRFFADSFRKATTATFTMNSD